jgi:hypothetical protein
VFGGVKMDEERGLMVRTLLRIRGAYAAFRKSVCIKRGKAYMGRR